MNFNSIEYLLFVPLVFICLALVKKNFSWLVLLLGSWYFYLTLKHLSLLLVLILVTTITYLVGMLLGWCHSPGWRRTIFWGGVTADLLIMGYMKYLPFLTQNLEAVFAGLQIRLSHSGQEQLIAIGVSYFVFQAISYQIDVYLGVAEPERHPGIFALYLGFFPKLLQGPIERAGNLMPQLRVPFSFDQENFRAGLLVFTWGFFKKAVVADRLALYVNTAYGDLPGHAGLPLLLATYLYALQIYYDFSGYTDMALGSARMFNIRLTQNFNAPYLATSVADFWRRWHISFSRWILDYLFKPLQIVWRDRRQAGTAAALIVTFLASGLWHGASWGFIAWGGLHGIYLATSVYYKPLQKKLHRRFGIEKSRWLKLWQIGVTFHLVCFAWIFFRAPTMDDAWYVVTHLASGGHSAKDLLMTGGMDDLSILSGSLVLIWTVYGLREKTPVGKDFYSAPFWFKWGAWTGLLLLLLLFTTENNMGFIYFQF
jgi:alginate O-acetyltransferase complex protein AlgI